jgi:hypothetical protein
MMVPFWSVGRRTSRGFSRYSSLEERGTCMRVGVQRENHMSVCYNVYICMFRTFNYNAKGTASLPVLAYE